MLDIKNISQALTRRILIRLVCTLSHTR